MRSIFRGRKKNCEFEKLYEEATAHAYQSLQTPKRRSSVAVVTPLKKKERGRGGVSKQYQSSPQGGGVSMNCGGMQKHFVLFCISAFVCCNANCKLRLEFRDTGHVPLYLKNLTVKVINVNIKCYTYEKKNLERLYCLDGSEVCKYYGYKYNTTMYKWSPQDCNGGISKTGHFQNVSF